MTKEQLEAIRQRVHNKNWMDPVDGIDSPQPRIDRAALLEEVDRLRRGITELATEWERGASPRELYAAHAREMRALLGEMDPP